MVFTLAQVPSKSAAEATVKKQEANSKNNIWLLILNPKIDFLLGDSLSQQHSLTAMFATSEFLRVKQDTLLQTNHK